MGLERIKEDCKRFLKENNIPTKYIDFQVENHFEKKKWVADILGLNEENNFRYTSSIEMNFENRPDLKAMMKYIEYASEGKYKVLDLQFMKSGKDNIKVSKAVMDTWDNLLEHCKTRLDRDLAIGREAFLKLYYRARGEGDIKHRYLCMFGDSLKDNRLINISINPYDYLTSSGEPYCSFTSCIRVDGEYFNTVFDYLNSDCVISTFISEQKKPERKVGRQFIYANKDAIAQTRTFGAMNTNDMNVIMKYMTEKFGGEWEKRASHPENSDFTIKRAPYIDTQGVYMTKKGGKRRLFVIEAGVCNNCGNPLSKEQNRSGVCDGCIRHMVGCALCGHKGFADEMNKIRDFYLCPKCYKNSTVSCEECGDRELKDNLYDIGGKNICQACYHSLTFECRRCGRRKFAEERTKIGTQFYCKDCAKHYVPCAVCETKKFDVDMVMVESKDGDIPICVTCYKKKTGKNDESVLKAYAPQTAKIVDIEGQMYAFDGGSWVTFGGQK